MQRETDWPNLAAMMFGLARPPHHPPHAPPPRRRRLAHHHLVRLRPPPRPPSPAVSAPTASPRRPRPPRRRKPPGGPDHRNRPHGHPRHSRPRLHHQHARGPRPPPPRQRRPRRYRLHQRPRRPRRSRRRPHRRHRPPPLHGARPPTPLPPPPTRPHTPRRHRGRGRPHPPRSARLPHLHQRHLRPPRGVMLPHRAILSNIAGVETLAAPLHLDRATYLSCLPLSHSYEHTVGLFIIPAFGGTVVFSRGIEHLAADMQSIRPTILTVVPRILEVVRTRILLQRSREKLWEGKLFDRTLAAGLRRLDGTATLADRALDPTLDRLVRSKVRARFGGNLVALVSGGARLDPELAPLLPGPRPPRPPRLRPDRSRPRHQRQRPPQPPQQHRRPPAVRRGTPPGRRRRGPGPRRPRHGRLLEPARPHRRHHPRRLAPHRRRRPPRRPRRADHHRPQEGHPRPLRRRERQPCPDRGPADGRTRDPPGRHHRRGPVRTRPPSWFPPNIRTPRTVAAALSRVNQRLSVTERIRRHALVPPFTIENGLLTPSQKIKRAAVLRTHKTAAFPPRNE